MSRRASLEPVLSLLRCPTCAAELDLQDDQLECGAGHRFPLLAGGRVPDLAADVTQPDSAGQRAMRFGPLVSVYERAWRPAFTRAVGGTDPDRETDQLLGWLGPERRATLLDVACGPGNTSRRLAAGVPDGRVLALDLSTTMLERAVLDTPVDAPVSYVRADAHHLPVADASVDGAHCAAALYLVADPGAVVQEIARAMAPGGRFVGMTIVPFAEMLPVRARRPLLSRVTTPLGLRYLGTDELRDLFLRAGLVDVRTERRGASLLFRAEKPG